MHTITRAYEDYLEAIFILEKHGRDVRSVEVASLLGVSRPAVSKTINELKGMGLLTQDRYRSMALTDEGRKVGAGVYEKHVLIKEFLMKIGVDEKTAEEDCCKMEHVVSGKTLDAFKAVIASKK